jgi:hypothetical protein
MGILFVAAENFEAATKAFAQWYKKKFSKEDYTIKNIEFLGGDFING